MSMPAEHVTARASLEQLLGGLAPAAPLPVADVTADSRRVTPGALFIACRGATHHGLEFAGDAVRAGAAAIVYDASTADDRPVDFGVPAIAVADLDLHVGLIADRFFGAPSAALDVIGVTGTNGKTTVAWMVARALDALGVRAGYSGTIGYGIDKLAGAGRMTTPDAIETHRRLAGFRDAGAEAASLEVSSHALDQRRVDGVRFDAAMFTNLTRDHLDYHGSIEAYAAAKARLFTDHCVRERIVNIDSEFGAELARRCGEGVVTVSTRFDRAASGRPFVFARSITTRPDASDVRFESSWGGGRVHVPLPGAFNVANAMLAMAYLLCRGAEPEAACAALGSVQAPPGRLERIGTTLAPAVYVDYAHTPDALENALSALQTHFAGRVWCVFGCGGERDAGKRPLMGRVAERCADAVVVTSDNPRGEAPLAIIDDILAGMRETASATVIEDRAAAIAWAIDHADDGDVVLIAGKGHEDYQLVAGDRLDFDDAGIARLNLERRREARR